MPDDSTPKKLNSLTLSGSAASLSGMAIGLYSGFNLVIPAIGAGAVWFIGSKVIKPRVTAYLPAIAVQGGHALWLAFGMTILGQWGANIADIVVLAVGIAWLWARPSIWPVAVLTAFQVLALIVNTLAISQQPFATPGHKALVVHIAFRLIAIFLMWQGYIRSRRNDVSSNPSIEATP